MPRTNSGFILRIFGYLTKSLIIGIIIFIAFAVWGTSGGFKIIVELGKLMAQIPAYVYLAVGGLWLFGKIMGK